MFLNIILLSAPTTSAIHTARGRVGLFWCLGFEADTLDYLGPKPGRLLIFKESLAFWGETSVYLLTYSMKMRSVLVVDGIRPGIRVEGVAVFDAIGRKRHPKPGSVGIISEEHLVTLGSGKIKVMAANFS